MVALPYKKHENDANKFHTQELKTTQYLWIQSLI
jgi:hypothetical protein